MISDVRSVSSADVLPVIHSVSAELDAMVVDLSGLEDNTAIVEKSGFLGLHFFTEFFVYFCQHLVNRIAGPF